MAAAPLILLLSALAATAVRPACGCTSFVVDCDDGAVVSARTLDFPGHDFVPNMRELGCGGGSSAGRRRCLPIPHAGKLAGVSNTDPPFCAGFAFWPKSAPYKAIALSEVRRRGAHSSGFLAGPGLQPVGHQLAPAAKQDQAGPDTPCWCCAVQVNPDPEFKFSIGFAYGAVKFTEELMLMADGMNAEGLK